MVQNASHAVSLDLATATYAGYGNFVDFSGGAGNDHVVGTAAANYLIGGGGADTLIGGDGDDTIIADAADFLGGYVNGGSGFDKLIFDGSSGLTLDLSSYGFDMVIGGSGADYLYVTATSFGPGFYFLGGDGNDVMSGGDGDDFFHGGDGADQYYGGHGDEIFVIDAADAWTVVSGGADMGAGDTVIVDSQYGYYFGNLTSQGVERFVGGNGNDIVYASYSNDSYCQQKSFNDLYGGKGDDICTVGRVTITTIGPEETVTTYSKIGITVKARVMWLHSEVEFWLAM